MATLTKDAPTGFHELVEEPQQNPATPHKVLTSNKNSNPSFAQAPLNEPDTEKKLTSSYIEAIKADESYPLLKAVYYSPYYKYFYLALVVSTLILTIWLIVDYKNIRMAIDNKMISDIEVIINVVVLVDTIVRIIIMGPSFCEIFTAILCVSALSLAWFWHDAEGIESVGDEVLVVAVCFTQYLRIAALIKNTRDKHAAEINLSQIDVDNYPDRRPSVVIKVQGGGESSRRAQASGTNIDKGFPNQP